MKITEYTISKNSDSAPLGAIGNARDVGQSAEKKVWTREQECLMLDSDLANSYSPLPSNLANSATFGGLPIKTKMQLHLLKVV
jgi:hypothetical protein